MSLNKEDFLAVYRHSMSHILAKAVIEIFGKENVQYAIGPQIADGFYYDFILPRPVNKDDFAVIESKMREILKRKEDWTRKEVSRKDALELLQGASRREFTGTFRGCFSDSVGVRLLLERR